MPPPSDLSFAESLTSEQRQNFYERHRFLAILMILVVLFSPCAGVYVAGLLGAGIGVLLSIAAYYLTPYSGFRLVAETGLDGLSRLTCMFGWLDWKFIQKIIILTLWISFPFPSSKLARYLSAGMGAD